MAYHRILLLAVCLSTGVRVMGKEIIVSKRGHDVTTCGITWDTPCNTLQFAINVAEAGDTISVEAHTGLIDICQSGIVIVNKSLVIEGRGPKPLLGCRHHSDRNVVLNVASFKYKHLWSMDKVVLRNLILQNGRLLVGNVDLTLEGVDLRNVPLRSDHRCKVALLKIVRSTKCRLDHWDGELQGEYESVDSSVRCDNLTASVISSQFYDNNMHFEGRFGNDVRIENSIFTQVLPKESGIGGLNVTLPYTRGTLEVYNCTFEKHIHFDPLQSIINIDKGTLRIETIEHKRIVYDPSKSHVTVNITDCIFRDNERGLSISKEFKNISITNCVFLRNMAMHAAAAIRIALDPTNIVYVNNCTFGDNLAGYNMHAQIPGMFEYDGEQVRISGDKVNGIMTLVGKGGAIRVHKGRVIFRNSAFVNNSASMLGGALFVDRLGHVELEHCYMENSDIDLTTMQGDIFFSSGSMVVDNTTFHVIAAKDHVTVLRHGGDHWSLDVKKLYFRCPVGHRLVMVNNTSHRIKHEQGLVRSHKLDQMYYYCENCGGDQYSVDHGFVNYSVTDKNAEYFTLLINGEEPFRSHPVHFEYGNITCLGCPYGADCEDGIKAVANFWGYKWGARVLLQNCPQDYCCTKPRCHNYSTCAAHRHGRLCGHCKNGYSEAMFSPNCVPNADCKNNWVWAMTMAMGLFYTLFLIFQIDIKNFLGSWHTDVKRLCSCSGFQQHSQFFVSVTKKKPRLTLSTQTDTSTPSNVHTDELQSHFTNVYSSSKISLSNDAETGCLGNDIMDNEEHRRSSYGSRISPDRSAVQESGSAQPNSHTGYTYLPRVAIDVTAETKTARTRRSDAGLLIILFYYFQDALLLHIDTVYTKITSKFVRKLKAFLVGVFRFRLDFYQFLDDICVFPGLQPVQKLLFKTLFVPYVVLLFGSIYLAHLIWKSLRSQLRTTRMRNSAQDNISAAGGDESGNSARNQQENWFTCRLSSGFILGLLFTYQKMATATFKLLNCVPIGNETVLFMDGTLTCFQSWQYGVMAYAFGCVIPFSIILMFGPPLLKRGSISLQQFFMGCLCPLPALLIWAARCVPCIHPRKLTQGSSPARQDTTTPVVNPETEVVLQLLQGPFKESKSKRITGQLCWAGVLIGRRLILFLCYTFINDVLVRLLCMLFACFLILMHHMYVRPYKSKAGNLAGSVSIGALLVVGAINLLRAAFEAAEYVPQGPYRSLMEICEEIENTLLLWLPLVGVCFIVVFVGFKIVILLVNTMLKCSCSHHAGGVETHVSP